MTKICRQCNQAFEITDSDLEFYEKVSPVFGGKKEPIPPPTLCPECRKRRRFAFYNERKLYARKCDGCAADIVSIHHEGKPRNVFCRSCYFDEKRDVLEYGSPVDLTIPFSRNFAALSQRVPQKWMIQKGYSENSIYCNNVGAIKDSYLTFMAGGHIENMLYCTQSRSGSHDCAECLFMRESSYCHGCVDAVNGYRLTACMNTENCRDSWFLRDCIGCSNCFGCANLRHKEYHFFNQPMTKEAYEAKMAEILPRLATHSGFTAAWDKVREFWTKQPARALHVAQCEGSSGDGLEHCKDVTESFDCFDSESGAYGSSIGSSHDFRDWNNYGKDSELILECIDVGSRCYQVVACHHSFNENVGLYYSADCMGCKDCFGCYGLQNKQYCILNRQYTREEYEELVPKIIERMRQDGEWGEFFDPSLSPFGYNETVAQEYYPLEKDEALRLGFNWSDYVSPPPQVEKIVKASQLPDSIRDVPDAILEWAVECEVSGRPFRIIKQELKFLREHGLPLPRRHPDVRHLDRMRLRNPRKLFDRSCMKCSKPISTTYAPDRPETVYCEECYLKEVY